MDAIASGFARVTWRLYADDAPFREGSVPLWDYAVVRDTVGWLTSAPG
jgi:hypothetical protein